MKRNTRLRCPFRKGTCEITRKTRRQCQACRLRKCLESGMKKESESRASPGGAGAGARGAAGVHLRGGEPWVLPIPAEHPYSLLWGVRWTSGAPFSPQVPLRDSCCLHPCPKGVLAKLGQVNWGEGGQRPLV